MSQKRPETEAIPSANDERAESAARADEKGEDPAHVSALVELLAHRRSPSAWPDQHSFVATCVDARHPTLFGRVKVRWSASGATGEPPKDQEWWVPTLHALTIRAGDRVLVQHAAGSAEPIVIGVIDGFQPRPELERPTGPRMELRSDEALRVETEDGRVLLEVIHDDTGPVVRVLQSDSRVDFRGKLSITATEVDLRASQGKVRIEGSDGVTLDGAIIRLN